MLSAAKLQPDFPPPSEQLRDATRERHRLIERVPALGRLFAKDFSLDEYRDLLARFYGFYAVVEPRLAAAFADPGNPFLRRGRTSDLIQDLKQLGYSEADISRLALCADVPPVDFQEQAIGIAYVLEGSTMGGMRINKHLLGQFGPSIGSAMAFYNGYGDCTMDLWFAFKTSLDWRFESDGEGLAIVVESANQTFDALIHWFEAMPSR